MKKVKSSPPWHARSCSAARDFAKMPVTSPTVVLMLNFMLMGMIQGPLAPAMSQINAAWLPGGIEQVWAFRCSPSRRCLRRWRAVGAGTLPPPCQTQRLGCLNSSIIHPISLSHSS